jgi:deoxyribonuclease V
LQISSTTRWNVTPLQAMQAQRELAARVIARDQSAHIRFVAGGVVGFEGAGNQTARAAVVVLSFPALQPVECAIARERVRFPYIPGLLSFREMPVTLRALKRLKTIPDILIVDGHGRAHPRRAGIACHLGVLLDRPTIGCAKSILCGAAEEPDDRVGAWTPLVDRGEEVGAAVRTRAGTKPVYVSIGHRVSLSSAIKLMLACCTRYRLPETTRYAHRVAGGEIIELNPE